VHPLTASTLSHLRRLFSYANVGQVGGRGERSGRQSVTRFTCFQ
jgi:hypothetical protein